MLPDGEGPYDLNKTDNCPSPHYAICLCQYSGEPLDEEIWGPKPPRDKVHEWVEEVPVSEVREGDNFVGHGIITREPQLVYDSPTYHVYYESIHCVEYDAKLPIRKSFISKDDT